MKRRDFLKAGGVGLVATAGVAAPAIAQSNPEVKWRLAASWPKALDTLYGGCEYFAKRVSEITDNKFQIQSFAAGELVPGLQVLDAVSNGTVEMGTTALYYYWGKNPAFTFGTSLPFGLNTRSHIAWLHFGGGTEMLNDLLKEYNTLGIPTGSTGAQMGGWFRKEIKGMDDFKGLNSGSAASPAPSSPRSAACRSRSRAATSIRRSRRAPSTPPNGSALTTTRSSAS
jgi:TRAP-type mannitol/chloroaromatic compound transport system substrate-binding protein